LTVIVVKIISCHTHAKTSSLAYTNEAMYSILTPVTVVTKRN